MKTLLRMTGSNMEVIYGDMVTKVQQVRPEPWSEWRSQENQMSAALMLFCVYDVRRSCSSV